MKRCFAVGAIVILFSHVVSLQAGPETNIAPFSVDVNAQSAWSTAVKFKKGRRANVIVVGDGKSYLGLYIYDPQGNCVARDDELDGKFLDDRWVIWYPRETQKYRIEIRNFGNLPDKCTVAIR